MRPELVYCSISGFGQTGPLSSMQAYAHLVNAMSGLMDLERGADPQPRVSYLQAADVLAGAHAFGSICAALLRRARTGQGATLDVSMLECLVCADDITYTAVLNGAPVERRARVGMLVYAVGEGHVAMQTAGAAHLLPRLAKLMGRPELVTDARFSTPMARRANWSALLEIVRDWLDTFESVEQAVTALAEARVPHAPMLSPEQVVAHPHMAARSAFPEVAHPAVGRVRVTSAPFHVDGAPVTPAGPAPYRVGEDTRAVLSELLGYSQQRVHELVRAGAVAVPDPRPAQTTDKKGR
jgi:crotonobetainyl-CoA:carnitine CoA-transferase CaiB-like acyl-CoA transferase